MSANAMYAIADNPPAKPSSPSVILTALVVPTSKIIQDILLSENVPKNPYGHISISSAYLKAANKT